MLCNGSDALSDVCKIGTAHRGQPILPPFQLQQFVDDRRLEPISNYLCRHAADDRVRREVPSHNEPGRHDSAIPDYYPKSDERRVGKEWVVTCRCGWAPSR